LERYGAIPATIERATGFGDAARRAIGTLPVNAHTSALDGIVDFCIARVY
jgi:hypothetical protein